MENSVFSDLYAPEVAFVMQQRAKLLSALETWLKLSGLTQQQAAEKLGLDQPRVSDIKNGKLSRFTLDKLMEITNRVGIDANIEIRSSSFAA